MKKKVSANKKPQSNRTQDNVSSCYNMGDYAFNDSQYQLKITNSSNKLHNKKLDKIKTRSGKKLLPSQKTDCDINWDVGHKERAEILAQLKEDKFYTITKQSKKMIILSVLHLT